MRHQFTNDPSLWDGLDRYDLLTGDNFQALKADLPERWFRPQNQQQSQTVAPGNFPRVSWKTVKKILIAAAIASVAIPVLTVGTILFLAVITSL